MRIDFKHLQKAKMNYFSHGFRVISISFRLTILALIGMVHALIPFIFLKNVSEGIKKLHCETKDF